MFKRLGLFFLTNLLVMITISIMWTLVSQFLGLQGVQGYIPMLLAFSLVWGMGGSFISLLMSRWMAKQFHGVEVIDPNTSHPDLKNLVERVYALAKRAGIKEMPEVGIYESPDVNAFATGPSKNQALVAVSTGLLQRMNSNEVEGVLGHEISHVANGDMVTMTLIQGVVNAFVLFFSRIVASIVASNVEEKSRDTVRWIVTIVADIVFTILGSIVVNYFSRAREYRADAGSAKFAGRENMIAALQRLKSVYELPLPAEEGPMATLKISNRDRSGFLSLFMTHPRLDDRIAALRNAQ